MATRASKRLKRKAKVAFDAAEDSDDEVSDATSLSEDSSQATQVDAADDDDDDASGSVTGAKIKRAKTDKDEKKKVSVKPVWQWKSGGGWVDYSDADCELLENAFQKGDASFSTKALSFGNSRTEYEFDFTTWLQRNTYTKRTRTIRRLAALTRAASGSAPDDVSYAKLVKRSSVGWGKSKVSEGSDTAASSHASAKKGGTKLVKRSAAADDADDHDAKVASAASRSSKGRDKSSKPCEPELASLPSPLSTAAIRAQASLGAQSCRKQPVDYGSSINADKHGKYCFDRMLENEGRLCGEYAVFYHSYSFAALLYEVQAAVAAILFRFKANFASLPRLLRAPFKDIPDAPTLMKEFKKMAGQDHNSRFRAVGICGTTSLLARDMEAPPKQVFLMGYSCSDLSFMNVLKELLKSCHVPAKLVDKLAKDIVKLSEKHGLDVSQFGGKRCKSGRAGHLLQIFLKRHVVDQFVYAALPFGVIDKKRMPLSKHVEGPGPVEGQVRICCNPSIFMRAKLARMYVYSADPTFHKNREAFQEELTKLLDPIVGAHETRTMAAKGIYGGELPSWYNSEDQRQHNNVKNMYK